EKSDIKPTTHQDLMPERMITNTPQGSWFDAGGLKSSTTLEALMRIQPIGHILIVAPKHIARSGWIDEIEKFEVPIRHRSLIFDSNEDRKSTRLNSSHVSISYAVVCSAKHKLRITVAGAR